MKSTSVKEWPLSERPRERLARHGAAALSDAELVAILLRTGIPGKDAVQLARDLLAFFGSLRGLFGSGFEDLRKVRGLGAARACALEAAAEIARRRLKEEILGRPVMRDPEAVLRYLAGTLADRKREIFTVLFLNKANRVLGVRDLFEGTVDETAVHPREIVKAALDCYATGVVLAHNHPSGRTEPSPEDRQVTRKIQDACAAVSVKVLDHIIVGDRRYFSFSEEGLL
ncbi:MAG: DNA repair protein RadC [Candidatus Omnitrophota bacterium]|jgi:DNA repair protein RadC